MEAEHKALRRKPLTDCTNTTSTATAAAAAAAAAATKKTSLISSKTAAVKSLKPSLKSSTNTGSNNPPISVPSFSPVSKAQRLSESGENDRRRSKPSLAWNQRQDIQTSKDKGKVVSGNRVIEPSYLSTHYSLELTASAGSGDSDLEGSGLPAAQNQVQATQSRKDKGKAVLETTVIEPFHLPACHGLQLPSFGSSGGSGIKISGAPAVSNQTQAAQTWKDKGKVVVENSFTQPLFLLTPHSVQIPTSAAGGSCCKIFRPLAAQNEAQTTQTRKDKGKAVLENHTNEPSLMSTPCSLRSTPSAASVGIGSKTPRPPAAQHQIEATQTRKEKGNAVSENLTLEPSHLSTTHNLQLHSSTVSGWNKKQATQTRKEKEMMVLGGTTIKTSYLSTPCNLQLASSASSGTSDHEKSEFLTVYTRRRAPETEKRKVGKKTLPLSCPPGKRIKDIGNNIFNGGADGHSQSQTDPLPVHKKKQSRVNRNQDAPLHALPQDEIERLRAYYADVDAFELPVEIASDSDLD